MARHKAPGKANKLLGDLPFVKRTFEGRFNEAPFVLDMDANLYIGPADELSRDAHSAVAVVWRYLAQTKRVTTPVRELLKDRRALLDAFMAFDNARSLERMDDDGVSEFRIMLHGTYDGAPLEPHLDDDLPAGPCGWSVNETKLHFYRKCVRMDPKFAARALSQAQAHAEHRLVNALAATEDDVSAATSTVTVAMDDSDRDIFGDRTIVLDD